jgi:iron complex outermembrane receptor protein
MCGTNTTRYTKSTPRRLLAAVTGVAIAFTGLYTSPASAQGIVLDEVIVTAQKREQSLEDVPAAVSAMSGETIRDLLGSAENARALANRVPSLNVESSNGRTQPRFYLRGLGNIDFDNNAAQPVGMVFDDIFLEGNVLRSLPLYDIERVEVLKGPQGSLFGRNTNAGLVKIDSVKPSDEQNAYVSLAYGERNTLAVEGAATVQTSTNGALRASVKYQRRDDWIDNEFNGAGDDFGEFEEIAYRFQYLVTPNDTFTGLFKWHGFQQDGSQPQVFYANAIEQGSPGLRPGFDETKANHDGAAGMDLSHYGLGANLAWDLDTFTLTSITGFDTVENFQFTDVDGGVSTFNPADIGVLGMSTFPVATGDGLDNHMQFTQEFRISADNDEVFFQAGVFILDENADIKTFDFNSGAEDIVRQQTDSFAVFGQVDWAATDVFSIIAGLRFTGDQKDLEVRPGPTSPSPADRIRAEDQYLSWDLAFTFDANEDWSLYGRIANASRGPVTLGRFGFVSSATTETSNSIEFGFKSDLMGGRARWNTSVYAFTNDDQQLSATGGGANVNRLLNADKVNGSGIETDFEVLITDNFLVLLNASYNKTEIDDPDLRDLGCNPAPSCTLLDPIVPGAIGPFGEPVVEINGNPLPRAPELMANIVLQWNIPVSSGDFYINTDWNYRDESNLFLHRSVEFVAEERWLGGLRIGYRSDDGLDVALVGRNITDELTVDGGINFNNLTAFINEPSFWGVEMRKDF